MPVNKSIALKKRRILSPSRAKGKLESKKAVSIELPFILFIFIFDLKQNIYYIS
jgi:hypothetical protein